MMEKNSVRTSASRKEAQKLGFRSALERRVYDHLKASRIQNEYEPRDFMLNYETKVLNAFCAECQCKEIFQKHTYLPDFVLAKRRVILECKGIFDNSDRNKVLSLVNQYKHLIFVVLLQNPKKKITKRVTYADWCDKNNILWLSDKENWIPKLKEIIKKHG